MGMKEILALQEQLAKQIAALSEREDVPKPAPKKKRVSARAKPKLVSPSLEKFLPVETDEDECVASYHEKDGNKVPPQSVKLVGKDELLIVWCEEHETAHYFLAQPADEKTFEIHEVWRGAQCPKKVKVTPSGDMDTEAALDAVEAWIESEDEDDEDDDA